MTLEPPGYESAGRGGYREQTVILVEPGRLVPIEFEPRRLPESVTVKYDEYRRYFVAPT